MHVPEGLSYKSIFVAVHGYMFMESYVFGMSV